jgi:hypothetical protein
MMTKDQRNIVLWRNRDNKKGRFTDATLSPASVMNMSSAVSMSPSSSTPTMQARPSEYVRAGLFLTRGHSILMFVSLCDPNVNLVYLPSVVLYTF